MSTVEQLTMGEVARVEELAEQSFMDLSDPSKPKGKLLAAAAFVVKRREDKDFTFKAALDMTFEQVTEVLGLQDENLSDGT